MVAGIGAWIRLVKGHSLRNSVASRIVIPSEERNLLLATYSRHTPADTTCPAIAGAPASCCR
jgi:hypothetical protein